MSKSNHTHGNEYTFTFDELVEAFKAWNKAVDENPEQYQMSREDPLYEQAQASTLIEFL